MEKENITSVANLSEIKEVYKAPIIEIIEVRVEKGFQSASDLTKPEDEPTENPTS